MLECPIAPSSSPSPSPPPPHYTHSFNAFDLFILLPSTLIPTSHYLTVALYWIGIAVVVVHVLLLLFWDFVKNDLNDVCLVCVPHITDHASLFLSNIRQAQRYFDL